MKVKENIRYCKVQILKYVGERENGAIVQASSSASGFWKGCVFCCPAASPFDKSATRPFTNGISNATSTQIAHEMMAYLVIYHLNFKNV